MEIRQVGPSGIGAAVALILEVFLQFDAPDDSEEGIRSFRAFVEEEEFRQTLLFFWGVCAGRAERRDRYQ